MAHEREPVVREAFLTQAESCESLGSPFTGRVCRLMADRLPPRGVIGTRVFDWQGDIGPSAHSVPLRLCGALNHLVVAGHDAGLAGVYPPASAADDELWAQIERVLDEQVGILSKLLDSAPQTNEVRRSVVLLPAWCLLADRFGLPLVISEVGASAGLNLFADRFHLKTESFSLGDPSSQVKLSPKWYGDVPPAVTPDVVDRRGCDLAPIDPTARDDRERLLSYIWPDQRDRVERTQAAIDIFADQSGGATLVDQRDAADWLEARLAQAHDGAVHIVQHTIAWQYFPDEVKKRGEALLAAAGEWASAASPLARISLEADDQKPGAAVSLTLWPDGSTHSLGRADFHGRWVDWRNPAA